MADPTRSGARLLALTLTLLACGDRPSELGIVSITPSVVLLGTERAATVRGGGFYNRATVSVEGTSAPEISSAWTVLLGAHEASSVVRQGADEIILVVPGELPLGSYDVTVVTPDGRQTTLAAGLVVVAELDAGTDAGTDAGVDGGVFPVLDGGLDAGTDGGPPALGPFGPSVRIDELSTDLVEDDPTLTEDLLEIFFNRPSASGDGDIWTARRSTRDAPFGPATQVTELNSSSAETSPEVAADGRTLFLASLRGGSNYDIYASKRDSRGSSWATPALIPELSTTVTESSAAPFSGALWITLGRYTATAGQDLFSSERPDSASAWPAPAPITELNTDNAEGGPMLCFDGLTIVFDSNRPGLGGEDLYWAHRSSLAEPFGPAELIPGVNTAATESDPWMSNDGRVLFFQRDGDLYQATR